MRKYLFEVKLQSRHELNLGLRKTTMIVKDFAAKSLNVLIGKNDVPVSVNRIG